MPFSLPFFQKGQSEESFFGLFIKDTEVIGFILEKRSDRIVILAQKQTELGGNWENLIEQVDELLFSLETTTHKHIQKVIFFVYSHFVDQSSKNIKLEYLKIFKNLLKQLELKPLGYIECYEAVAEYLEKKEHVPLTAILVELDKKNLGVFLYKGGQKVFSRTLGRTDSITDDIETAFHHIGEDVLLPSRIILYDSKDLHKESTTIISHQWNPELFVQFPRVEVLKQEELNTSLCNIFESQVADGFKTDKKENVTKDEEVMGFMIGEDIAEKEVIPEAQNFEAPKVSLLSKVKSFFSTISIPNLPKFSGNKIPLIGGVTLLFLALFCIEYFLHKATLDVLLPSKTIAKELPYTETVGSDNSKIKTNQITIPLNDKKSATGKKDVGDKAHGEVIISSFDDKDRVISRGTILQTGSQKFTLDDDVTVPAQSSTTINGGLAHIAGTAKGKVTASALGPDGNISKNQNFTVGDFSSSLISANSTSAFSGGSSKQVTTVARQDIEDVKKSLISKAKEQAADKIKSEAQDQQVLNDLTTVDFDTVTPSKEIGEEASEVSVSAKVVVSYYVLAPSDIKSLIKTSLKDEVPAGYLLNDENISYDFQNVTQSKKNISLKINARALVLKNAVPQEIIKKVKGKTVGSVISILKNNFQATSYVVTFSPRLPLFSNWMPFFGKNISLKISTL